MDDYIKKDYHGGHTHMIKNVKPTKHVTSLDFATCWYDYYANHILNKTGGDTHEKHR